MSRAGNATVDDVKTLMKCSIYVAIWVFQQDFLHVHIVMGTVQTYPIDETVQAKLTKPIHASLIDQSSG